MGRWVALFIGFCVASLVLSAVFVAIKQMVEFSSERGVSYWIDILVYWPLGWLFSLAIIGLFWAYKAYFSPYRNTISADISFGSLIKNQFMDPDTQFSVCLHESGHAAAHLAFYWPIVRLRIHCRRIVLGGDQILNGRVGSIPESDDDQNPDILVANMKVALAGYLSEELFGDGRKRLGASNDLKDFEESAREWLSWKANNDREVKWFHSAKSEAEADINLQTLRNLQDHMEAEMRAFLRNNEAFIIELANKVSLQRELIFGPHQLKQMRARLVL